jgi:hypothetical protein
VPKLSVPVLIQRLEALTREAPVRLHGRIERIIEDMLVHGVEGMDPSPMPEPMPKPETTHEA